MELVVNLDVYSGPLDLLLDLITKHEVDIYDIEISKITKHYLDVIENSVYGDGTDISAFLVMSTTLVEIKSRSLVPINDTEEDDDEIITKEQLIERLLEYKKYKEASEYFKKLEVEGRKSFSKIQSDIADFITEDKEVILNTDVNVLSILMEKILKRMEDREDYNPFEKIIEKDLFPVEKYISKIKDTLIERKNVLFEDLIFYDGSRSELITVFISILELCKNSFLRIVQDDEDKINISLVGDFNEQ